MTNRLADQVAEMEAKELAEHPPAIKADGSSQSVPMPTYVVWRPWYKRFLAKGCGGCGGNPPGWLQKQIQTPGRIKRFVLWCVNLMPRGASLVRAVTGGLVPADEFTVRQKACSDCHGALVSLRAVKGTMRETSYCGLCDCPKWWLSRNAVANWFKKRTCPLSRHPGVNPRAVYELYVDSKRKALTPSLISRESDPTPSPPPIPNCQCGKKSKVRGSGKKS